MKWILILPLLIVLGCAARKEPPHPSGLVVTETNPNKWTALTKQNLLHLAQVYDLSPFLYTKTIKIESRVIPHSHPVLTLNSRNAEAPKKLLSVFLHEQLHWWLTNNKVQTDLAIKDLKKIYPKAPVTKSMGPNSTYLHLIVCYLELKAVSFYLGKKDGREVISSIMNKDKIYPWIYNQVLNKDLAIQKIVKKHKLLPPPLN